MPSSTSVIAVTATTGLVIEKMRKMVSSVIGVVWPGPWTPKPCWKAIWPWRPISRYAPGILPLCTSAFSAVRISPSLAGSKPSAAASPCTSEDVTGSATCGRGLAGRSASSNAAPAARCRVLRVVSFEASPCPYRTASMRPLGALAVRLSPWQWKGPAERRASAHAGVELADSATPRPWRMPLRRVSLPNGGNSCASGLVTGEYAVRATSAQGESR